jgi:hypothetical protein
LSLELRSDLVFLAPFISLDSQAHSLQIALLNQTIEVVLEHKRCFAGHFLRNGTPVRSVDSEKASKVIDVGD